MKHKILNELGKSSKSNKVSVEILKGLILGRNISSTVCANYISGYSAKQSKIRRIERFYAKGYLKQSRAISISILSNCFEGERILLSMDRTNWSCGKKDINALIVYGSGLKLNSMLNIELLDNHGGNSCFEDRERILDPVIERIGLGAITALLCDREFFSLKFVNYLIDRDIPFVIRVKENLNIVKPLIKCLRVGCKTLRHQVIGRLGDKDIVADLSIKSLTDEYLITISYKVDNPLKLYRKRWNIECFFKSIKTAGFNIEDTRITRLERLKTLFMLCALAYLACFAIGKYRHYTATPMKFKKTLNCYQFSFFRYGLDWITELIFSTSKPLINLSFHPLNITSVG